MTYLSLSFLYYNSAKGFQSIWDFCNKNEMSILYILNYFFKIQVHIFTYIYSY